MISIFNRFTYENTIFNPLRAARPGAKGNVEEISSYLVNLLSETEKSCDFCQYSTMTAEESFGRIESTHASTAGNSFKYDVFHGLVMLRHHNPLQFNKEQLLDFMHTAMRWFATAHKVDPTYRYPHLMWDILPKASASQVHPHAQLSLSPDRFYGMLINLS